MNGVSAQPTARVLHAELESTAATDDAPVEDASHQQALQHGKGGTEQHKLQRQLGQRFRDLPDALTLLLPANGSPESAQPAANATAMTDAPAKLKTDITPGTVTCLALPSQRYPCGDDVWRNACFPANTPVLARQPELSSHMGPALRSKHQPLSLPNALVHKCASCLNTNTSHASGVVLVLTLFMAAASALGATPYFFVHRFNKEYSALASAVACGVMLAASFDLVHEGQPYGANLVILGVLVGTANLPEPMHSHIQQAPSPCPLPAVSGSAVLRLGNL